MEEKDLQKQQEYTFTVPRAEGQKVYHFGARRFTILAPGGLNCWPALYWYVLSVWWARLVIWVIIFISSVRNGLIF